MEPSLMGLIFEAVVSIGVAAILLGIWKLYSKIADLHRWHDKEDEEGVKVWYTRNKDMEETLSKMVEILDRLDRREERSLLIQNETIKVMQEHTVAITKLVAVVDALAIITKRNGK